MVTGSPVTAAPVLAVRVLPGRVEHVKAVRRWVGALAAGAGCEAGDPELAATELFTNAIRHSRSGTGGVVTVIVVTAPGVVVVHVHDQGADDDKVPCVRPASLGESGRGLALVAAISVHLAVGPVVWCRQAAPDDPSVAAGGCCVWCHIRPATASGAVSEGATCKVPQPRSAAEAGAAIEQGSGGASHLLCGRSKLPAERR